jgi:hypothetical protein
MSIGWGKVQGMQAVEKREEKGEARGPEVYCAVEKQSHYRTVKDLEKQEEPPETDVEATVKEKMGWKLKSAEGKKLYKKRKERVESVFGILNQALGL